jgi:hypothetical protein
MDKEIQELLSKLSVVSESVFNYADNKLYLNTPDSTDTNHILSTCCSLMYIDINNLGFFIDEEINIESIHTSIDRLYNFLYIFHQDYFDQLFSSSIKELDELKNTRLDSLTNNEENILTILINKLLIYFPEDIYLNQIKKDLSDVEYRYNSTFVTYLQNIIDSIPYEDNFKLEDNSELIAKFLNKFMESKKLFEESVNRCISIYPHKDNLDIKHLQKAIRDYDRGKITIDHLSTYAWIETTDDKDLTEEQKLYKKKILTLYS